MFKLVNMASDEEITEAIVGEKKAKTVGTLLLILSPAMSYNFFG